MRDVGVTINGDRLVALSPLEHQRLHLCLSGSQEERDACARAWHEIVREGRELGIWERESCSPWGKEFAMEELRARVMAAKAVPTSAKTESESCT